MPRLARSYDGTPWSFEACEFSDFSGWSDAAEAELRAQGVPVDSYKYRVFLLPPSTCGFVGEGSPSLHSIYV